MGKNEPQKLTNPGKVSVTDENAASLVSQASIDEKVKRKPVLGMTWLKMTGSYSLAQLRKNAENDSYKELEHLQKAIRKYDTIEDFLTAFRPHNGEMDPNDNETLKNALKGMERDNIIHIHCKAHGFGKFTLFGFQYENVFEVLLLDPQHEIANAK